MVHLSSEIGFRPLALSKLFIPLKLQDPCQVYQDVLAGNTLGFHVKYKEYLERTCQSLARYAALGIPNPD
jgi:hypothetical protein